MCFRHHPARHRVERRKTIERVEAFTLTVARYIASEFHARQKRLQRQASPPAPSVSGEEKAREEILLGYLDDCMETLPEADRDLITGYYEHQGGEKIKQKKKIASSLGVSTGGLRIRAFRLRKKLEECVSRRMKQNPEVSTQC
jgi:DNA-directed RNA polymerase specialized sigma24 family protein